MGRDILSSVDYVSVLAVSHRQVFILDVEKIGGIMKGFYKIPFRKKWVLTKRAWIRETILDFLRKIRLYNKPF